MSLEHTSREIPGKIKKESPDSEKKIQLRGNDNPAAKICLHCEKPCSEI